jgi:hypothetical protein
MFVSVPLPEGQLTTSPVIWALLLSMFFFTMTVMVSFLIDLRVLRPMRKAGCYARFIRKVNKWRFGGLFNFMDRFIDGLFLGAAMAATTLVFQTILFNAILHIERPWHIRLFFISSFALLGLIIGFLVPATASRHLNLREKSISGRSLVLRLQNRDSERYGNVVGPVV